MAEGERMRWTLSRWRECVRFLSSRHQDAVVPTVERGWRESGLVCLCTHPPTGRSRWSWSLLPCLPPVKWQKSVTGETIQATHFISLIRSVHERVAHQYRLNVWLKFYKVHRKKNSIDIKLTDLSSALQLQNSKATNRHPSLTDIQEHVCLGEGRFERHPSQRHYIQSRQKLW